MIHASDAIRSVDGVYIRNTDGSWMERANMYYKRKTDNKKSIETKLGKMPDYVREWCDILVNDGKADSTVITWLRQVDAFLHFIDEDTSRIHAENITYSYMDQYLNTFEVTNKSRKQYRKAVEYSIDSFLDFIYSRNGNSAENIGKRVESRTFYDFRKFVEKDVKNLFKYCVTKCKWGELDEKVAALTIILILTSGGEVDDFLRLKWRDYDEENKIINFNFGSSKIYLFPEMNVLIDSYIGTRNYFMDYEELTDRDYFFIEDPFKRMFSSMRDINKDMNRISQKAIGRIISEHKLQECAYDVLYMYSHDTDFVRKVTGNSDINFYPESVNFEESTYKYDEEDIFRESGRIYAEFFKMPDVLPKW